MPTEKEIREACEIEAEVRTAGERLKRHREAIGSGRYPDSPYFLHGGWNAELQADDERALVCLALRILAGPTPEQVECAARAHFESSTTYGRYGHMHIDAAIAAYISSLFTESQVPG